ncbi:nickel pincer cofactor biosynthesis protein LarC [uncultured Pseudokineococcus sp.]|uniref:nickel pincer cofactor biosynthesis protein LarC n=1 Tax=uncultured Pseudokineococcus sp. TaxID=1642928 RepID=UPI002615039D|nr:nickel pincer cofactor biosynthesis protein LarC [uncultured Pseudokineococcus sp.]
MASGDAPSPRGTDASPTGGGGLLAWVDASAGVAGDMLLGALLDAGADLASVQRCVDAVVPGSVRLGVHDVERAGLLASKLDVEVLVADPPHRTWAAVAQMIGDAELPAGVRDRALAVFARLAEAEGRVHGMPPEDVHFHEVGALDAVADVVGCCAALEDLGVEELVTSPMALGSGTVRAAHGVLPVPVPAVLQLVRGWDVLGGGEGELTTPTGAALLTALCTRTGALPRMDVRASGQGAGTRDVPGRANVTRVVLGAAAAARAGAGAPVDGGGREDVVVLEATVDDLDPRVWPDVLHHLLAEGALDAWLTPVLMKKGRPGHVLSVLAAPASASGLSARVLELTSTLGVRRGRVERDVLQRDWRPVRTAGGQVRVKVGHRDGAVLQATPEFEDALAAARRSGAAVADVLDEARAAGRAAGLVAGGPWPPPGAPQT